MSRIIRIGYKTEPKEFFDYEYFEENTDIVIPGTKVHIVVNGIFKKESDE